MRISNRILRTAELRRPNEPGDRIYLDKRGIHHKTEPFKNFAGIMEIHARGRNLAAAEGLFIVERLAKAGMVHPGTEVESHEAIFQTFRGTRGQTEAAHLVPCQFVLAKKFPHQLRTPQDKLLSNLYLNRVINLFARCTWAPIMINLMDSKLDYTDESSFVHMYITAVKQVCKGHDAYGAFREFNWKKEQVLKGVHDLVEDTSLTDEDIAYLEDALIRQHGSSPDGLAKVENILNDRQEQSELKSQQLIVVEKYLDEVKLIPHEVHTGQMQHSIEQENWGDGAASAVSAG